MAGPAEDGPQRRAYAAAVADVPAPVLLLVGDEVVHANRAAVRQLGAGLRGRRLGELVAPDDVDRLREAVHEAQRWPDTARRRSVVVVTAADLQVRVCAVVPLRLDDEAHAQVVLTRAQRPDDGADAASPAAPAEEALALVDADQRFLMATGAMARALGVPREELVGRTAGDVAGSPPGPPGASAVGGVLQRFVTPAGAVVWEELVATPLPGSDPPRAVLELRDATAQHAAQAAGAAATLQETSAEAASHALLVDRLADVLEVRRETGAACAVLFVDLDGFGRVNSAVGHVTGDRVLEDVLGRVRRAVRPQDLVVRWGGDQFVVLAEHLRHPQDAIVLAERVAHALSRPWRHREEELELSASVGVALAPDDDGVDALGLLARADAAMYRAKGGGGGRWWLYDEALHGLEVRRVHLEGLLERAVPDRRVALHVQPIVDTATRRVVAGEALLRLRDDDASLVLPGEFVAHAEEVGLLTAVEHEVLRQACTTAARWPEDVTVSVNVCGRMLRHMGLLEEMLLGVLGETGLAPSRLTCEVTEHGLADTGWQTRAGMHRLVQAGLRFSVDDFGTGYNSLTYLRTLPVAEIKIDKSFVAVAEPAGRAIVRGVAALADDLEVRCVAEGVERSWQHELLLDLGVRYAQGWHYGLPVPAGEFAGLLA